MTELTFTNKETALLSLIIEPLCYVIEIKTGEQYLLRTKETDLIFEYTKDVITVTQNYERGFALLKWDIESNSYQVEYDHLDAGRIG